MRNAHHGGLRWELGPQRVLDESVALSVHGGSGFVQDEDFGRRSVGWVRIHRAAKEGTRYAEELHLAGGEIGTFRMDLSGKCRPSRTGRRGGVGAVSCLLSGQQESRPFTAIMDAPVSWLIRAFPFALALRWS